MKSKQNDARSIIPTRASAGGGNPSPPPAPIPLVSAGFAAVLKKARGE